MGSGTGYGWDHVPELVFVCLPAYSYGEVSHKIITSTKRRTRTLLVCVVVAAVLALTHRYNAVRGHRTGSNNSGVED